MSAVDAGAPAAPAAPAVPAAPSFPLIALGDVNAAACEGDACLIPSAGPAAEAPAS
ncbi:hypothetical protein [Leifsonia lichenia]